LLALCDIAFIKTEVKLFRKEVKLKRLTRLCWRTTLGEEDMYMGSGEISQWHRVRMPSRLAGRRLLSLNHH